MIRFGTDGWRGVMADEFTFPNLRRVAQATADHILQSNGRIHPVLVGYDRRFLSAEFAQEAARVLRQAGLSVRLSKTPVTTPSVSVALVEKGYSWGIMITASHNPAAYNGFKLKEGCGRSAPPDVTVNIESRLQKTGSSILVPPSSRDSLEIIDWMPLYETHLRSRLNWKLLNRVTGAVVFDPLYGVASGIPERLLRRTNLTVFSLHVREDPLFGNLHPEPIEPYVEELQNEVRRHRALAGIAMDGDADRLGVVDDQGRYLTPHQVFPLLALYGIEHKKWRGKIVQSVSLGALGPRIAEAFGLPFEEVPVGFKHVAQRMIDESVAAGGEESGGYAFQGGLPERDGIYCGLLFLEMIAALGKPPSRLLADMEKRFGPARFRRIDIRLQAPLWDKEKFVATMTKRLPDRLAGRSVREVRTLDGIKIVRDDGSWLLLRPSGTEPLMRTYAESSSWPETDRLLKWAGTALAHG